MRGRIAQITSPHRLWWVSAAIIAALGATAVVASSPSSASKSGGSGPLRSVATSTATPPVGVCSGQPGVILPAAAVGSDMQLIGSIYSASHLVGTGVINPDVAAPSNPVLWVQAADYMPSGAPMQSQPFPSSAMVGQNAAVVSQVGVTIESAATAAGAEQAFNTLALDATGLPGTTVTRGPQLPTVVSGIALGDESIVTTQSQPLGVIVLYVVRVGDSVLRVSIAGGPASTAQSDQVVVQAALAHMESICGASA